MLKKLQTSTPCENHVSQIPLARHLLAACSAGLALSLAACGGGGDAATSAAPALTSAEITSSAAPAAAADAGTSTAMATATANANPAVPGEAAAASTSVASAGASTASGASSTPYGQDAAAYTMTFNEDFNSFDKSKWNDQIWYEAGSATRNYTVEDGSLKIWPQRDANGKFFNRTIDTDGKFYQTYGYFEIEAKLPKGKGTWPAFWLFNHIGNRRPEMDVMEAYAGGPAPWGQNVNGVAIPTMYAATIWKDATVQAGMMKVNTGDLTTAFHKYAVKWEPNKQTYYFDGKPVYTLNVSMPDPMYLMVDLWFGSASGQGDNSTPQGKANSYEVNYVRAWKFK